MKRIVLLLVSIITIFMLAGCGEKVETFKANIDEKMSLISGEDRVSDEEKAKDIAKKFASEFLTLKGRTEENYIGGYEYLHPEFREEFITTMKNEYFLPFDEMVQNVGGEDKLPEVSDVIVESISEDEFVKEGKTYKSYFIDLFVKFKDTEFDTNRLSVYVTNLNNIWAITGIEI